jgi:hypothetical protein
MPLFPCQKCNCVEDTALCRFWSARLQEKPTICSACDPKIAKWHGEFPQESAQGWAIGGDGFLFDKRDVEWWLGQPIEIIGPVQQGACEVGMPNGFGHVASFLFETDELPTPKPSYESPALFEYLVIVNRQVPWRIPK